MSTRRTKKNTQQSHIDSLIASLQSAHQEQFHDPANKEAKIKRDRLVVALCDALGYIPQPSQQLNRFGLYNSWNARIDFLDEQVPNWHGFDGQEFAA